MNSIHTVWGVLGLGLMGCAVTPGTSDTGPATDTETLAEQASITDNGWTANAITPSSGDGVTLSAQAYFTGSGTRKMGVCYLQLTNTGCSTESDCSGFAVPTGGFRYCALADGAAYKVCALKMGSSSSYCAGTPANGGTAIGPGMQVTPPKQPAPFKRYISYACFEGCAGAATDPSVSSASTGCGLEGQPACPY